MEEYNSNANLTTEQSTEKVSEESDIGTETSKDNEVLNVLHSPTLIERIIPSTYTDNVEHNDASKELWKEPIPDVIADDLNPQDTVESELEKMHSNVNESVIERETNNEQIIEHVDKTDWTDDINENIGSTSNVKRDEQAMVQNKPEDKELDKECEKINFHHIANLVNDNVSTVVETPCGSTEKMQQKTEFSKENSSENTSQNDECKTNSLNENDVQNSSVEETDEHLKFSTTKDQIENMDDEGGTSLEKKNDYSNIENQKKKIDFLIENPNDTSEKRIFKETEKERFDDQTNNSFVADPSSILYQDKDKSNYSHRENTEFVQVNTENEKDGEDNEKEDETNNRALMEHDPIASDSFEPINSEDREGADEELCIIPDTQREISQVTD